jgi:dTDP-4-dehydrorhamnose reductase
MKILLFGKSGQLGWELQRSLLPLGELVALDAGSRELCGDFTRLNDVEETVRAVAPDVIVNAAAYTAVDKAESEPERVRAINALAPGALASEAAKLGAWLVHYSTDYVFDGSGDKPWDETDSVGPLNVYGKTKLEGEAAIIRSGCSYLIFRTSWVFAARGENFAKKILRLAQERDRLTIVDDQVGAPTGAELLADVTAHSIRVALQHPELAGLYHLVATGETSWHGYARFVLNFARQAGIRLQTGPEDLVPVSSNAFSSPALRPKNSRLNTIKLGSAFGLKLPPWETGVARMLTEILENHHDPA